MDEMKNKPKALLFWSGGKDSWLALNAVKNEGKLQIVGLICVIERESNQIKFHGIPESIVTEQARLMGLTVQRIYVHQNASNQEYCQEINKILDLYSRKGINHLIFGDIHLADIKQFKENWLVPRGFQLHFPLWGQSSLKLAQSFFESGAKAIITSIRNDLLDTSFLAQEFNPAWLSKLPSNIDPCGENGEFHTFVFFAPGFKMRVNFSKSMAKQYGPYLITEIKDP